MANLKNITDVPVVESAEGLNLIVNDNGAAKQIAASAVGAQADWNVTDETSPAFIRNKPVEEWDLDIDIITTFDVENNNLVIGYTVNTINTYANIKNKIFNGEIPKIKAKMTCQPYTENSPSCVEVCQGTVTFFPAGFDGNEDAPDHLSFYVFGDSGGFMIILTSDDVVQAVEFV